MKLKLERLVVLWQRRSFFQKLPCVCCCVKELLCENEMWLCNIPGPRFMGEFVRIALEWIAIGEMAWGSQCSQFWQAEVSEGANSTALSRASVQGKASEVL